MSRKIKKSVSILLALVMLCGVLAVAPVTVGATATTYTTADGKGTYSFDPVTGELHLISGEFTGTAWQYHNGSEWIWTADGFNNADINSVTADFGVQFTGSCYAMFYNFTNCTSINLRNVNTSDVTSMYAMFQDCIRLKNINVSNFDTQYVTNISYMFYRCGLLKTLDLSSFDTKSVNSLANLFLNCNSLSSLTISDKFNIGIQSRMSLNNGKSTDKGWITSNSITGEIVSGADDYAVIAAPGSTTKYIWISESPNYTFNETTGELYLISGFFRGSTWRYHNGSEWIWTAGDFNASDVKFVTANVGVKFTGDCYAMFYNFTNCKSIDLRNVDTSNVTRMESMFYNCSGLTNIDVSNFDTGKVEKINDMFGNCRKLTSLDLSSFKICNTNSGDYFTTNTANMFSACPTLKELTISNKFTGGITGGMALNNGKSTDKGWITSNSITGEIVSGTGDYAVIAAPDKTTTYTWFAGVYEFIESTGELHLISGFFRGSAWQYHNGSEWIWTAGDFNASDVKFVTANVGVRFDDDCYAMFYNFTNCTSIDLRNVNTSNVTGMYSMFYNCYNLKKIDVSNFDTDKVTDVSYMFGNCRKLTSLDLSSFKINSTTNTGYMFDSCITLKELTISDKFTGGITSGIILNNGEDNNGWRIKGEPTAAKVSGNSNVAVITNPEYLPTQEGETKTYKWIGYFDVDWKNWDGTKLVKTEEYKAETNIHPTYKGATPTKPDSDGKRYTFAGWTDGENTYGVDYELPLVTNDVTYTAVFTEAPIKFFAAHSLTLDGDIGVNFYIDVSAAGITPQDILSGDSTLTLNFSWDTDPAPVTDVSKDVAAAEMACKIKADGIVAGAKDYTESEIYSVRDYGMTIINNPSKYSETLVDLAKKLLDYGAKAQKVFKILPGDLANKDVSYTMTNVSANDIQAAIEAESANAGKTASNMASGTSDFGLKYSQSTVVYLTKSTLRHYYLISDQEKYDNVKANFSERKLPYVYIEYSNIAAADLDKLQTFTIDSKHTYYYSALNYAKDVIGSNSPDANKKLAMAMYWYNQAANAYFK